MAESERLAQLEQERLARMKPDGGGKARDGASRVVTATRSRTTSRGQTATSTTGTGRC